MNKQFIIEAFCGYIEHLANVPGRNKLNNVLEAKNELISVCKKLKINDRQFIEHCEAVINSLERP